MGLWGETIQPNRNRILAYAAGIAVLFLAPSILPTYGTGAVLLDVLSLTLVYGIVAIAVNLLLNYTGLLSFGHALYFGAGVYTVAFFSFNFGLFNFDYLMLLSIVISLIVAAVFGALCVRHTAVYFMILTFSLQEIVHIVLHKLYYIYMYGLPSIPTGGSEGLPILIPVSRKYETVIFGMKYTGERWRILFVHDVFYYYVLISFVICVVAMWIIVNSPLGKTLRALKTNPLRAEFVGVRVKLHRWIIFVISGVFSGVAGALWAPVTGFVDPHIFHWEFAGAFVFMAVLGGSRVFLGPLLGAFLYVGLRHVLYGLTTYYTGILGIILVICVITFPRGVLGEVMRLREAGYIQLNTVANLKSYIKLRFSRREAS
ncbi:MAG: branched-chain amino acid ABC transporter permease [Candidatus Geothermarchaeales archaeon]